MSLENIAEILEELKKPFPPEVHKDRPLPGSGGKWLYVPWQAIRDRLDELFPLDWSASYSDPVVVGDYMVLRCKLTILLSKGGITRVGVGNDKAYPEVNDKGKSKVIGTPPERARADAFRSAAEEFGIAAYLDNQAFVARYLNSKGDGRGVKYAQENGWKESGAMGSPKVGARGEGRGVSKEAVTQHTRPVLPQSTPSPLAPRPSSPSYSDRIKEVIAKTGHNSSDIRRIASSVLGREVNSGSDIRSDAECIAVQEALLNQPVGGGK